jgi:chromosome segregation ATPase
MVDAGTKLEMCQEHVDDLEKKVAAAEKQNAENKERMELIVAQQIRDNITQKAILDAQATIEAQNEEMASMRETIRNLEDEADVKEGKPPSRRLASKKHVKKPPPEKVIELQKILNDMDEKYRKSKGMDKYVLIDDLSPAMEAVAHLIDAINAAINSFASPTIPGDYTTINLELFVEVARKARAAFNRLDAMKDNRALAPFLPRKKTVSP